MRETLSRIVLIGVVTTGIMCGSVQGAPLDIWAVNDSFKVLPGDAPQNSNSIWSKDQQMITLYGAKNEVIGFQVVLRAEETIGRVDLSLTELMDGEYRIPHKRVSLFREHYIKVTDRPDPKFVTLGPGDYPDPLLPWIDPYGSGKRLAAPFAVFANRNQPIWIDIDIPAEAKAGIYRGKLMTTVNGQTVKTLSVALTVWDFSLPRERHLSAYIPLYEGSLGKGEGFYEGDHPNEHTWSIVKQYQIMAHQHRFVTQVIDGRENPTIQWNNDGSIRSIDWSTYDRFLGPVLDGSLFEDQTPPDVWKVGPFVWWGCQAGNANFGSCNYKKDAHLPQSARDALANYAKAVSDHFEEKGWKVENVFMYFVDEPKLKDYRNLKTLIIDYGDAIHQKTRKVKHFVTVFPEDIPEASEAIDIWGTWAPGYIPTVMQRQQATGDKAWVYQSHPPFIGGSNLNDEGIGFRTWPWIAWKYHVDGIFLWVGNFWNDEPYLQARNWNTDLQGNGVMFYPGGKLHVIGLPDIRGPVPSFRMKAWRRGMQDYEYLWLLKQLGMAAEADKIVGRLVQSALNHGGYRPQWRDPYWASPGRWSHDAEQWELARQGMGRLIAQTKAGK